MAANQMLGIATETTQERFPKSVLLNLLLLNTVDLVDKVTASVRSPRAPRTSKLIVRLTIVFTKMYPFSFLYLLKRFFTIKFHVANKGLGRIHLQCV